MLQQLVHTVTVTWKEAIHQLFIFHVSYHGPNREHRHMKINSVVLPIYTAVMAIKYCTNTVVQILYAIQTLFPIIPNNEPK